jgi:hypothetical protein
MVWKCFCNELEPFEGVPTTAGLELWLQKVTYVTDNFEGNWGLRVDDVNDCLSSTSFPIQIKYTVIVVFPATVE